VPTPCPRPALLHDSVQYRIVPFDLHAHLFEVRCTVDEPDAAGQRFRLPTWIPGSYLIREFARQFVDVRAESSRAPLAIVKEAKDVWRAAPVQSCGHRRGAGLRIRPVRAHGVRRLDPAYFNGPAVFLCPRA
jgi:predicted metalloprotease with PDZ domain